MLTMFQPALGQPLTGIICPVGQTFYRRKGVRGNRHLLSQRQVSYEPDVDLLEVGQVDLQ